MLCACTPEHTAHRVRTQQSTVRTVQYSSRYLPGVASSSVTSESRQRTAPAGAGGALIASGVGIGIAGGLLDPSVEAEAEADGWDGTSGVSRSCAAAAAADVQMPRLGYDGEEGVWSDASAAVAGGGGGAAVVSGRGMS